MHLHKAIRKYGFDNFIFEQIDCADSMFELNALETYWIKYYDSTNKEKGYNNKYGGSNGKHLPETIEKIREAGRGRIVSESTREKLRKNIPPNHTGKRRSDETLKKMSEAQKGRKQAPHVLEALRASIVGRKQSPETIEKRASKLRGRKKPEGMMEKLRLHNLGSKRSEESRRKMSEAKRKKR